MITFPGPERLALGMTVSVAAHMGVDLAQRSHVVVDDVAVMAFAPEFVRTGPTKAGKYLYWESGCIFMTPDAAGTTALPGDDEFTIIEKSVETWNTDTSQCSYMDMKLDPRKALEVGNDKINVIKFRDTTWGRPAIADDPARAYDPSAAGITTATYIDDGSSSRDGAILDADVEINGVNFDISENCVQGQPQTCTSNHSGTIKADLQNTLTHELGHAHGLEHPCLASGDPARTDDQGNPVPECSSLAPDDPIRLVTMYNFQDPGETIKQTLAPDDINSMCQIYPLAKDPGTCEAVGAAGGGCCSVSGHGDRSGGILLLAGATVLTVLRRRKVR
jgi:hypothetical protein